MVPWRGASVANTTRELELVSGIIFLAPYCMRRGRESGSGEGRGGFKGVRGENKGEFFVTEVWMGFRGGENATEVAFTGWAQFGLAHKVLNLWSKLGGAGGDRVW